MSEIRHHDRPPRQPDRTSDQEPVIAHGVAIEETWPTAEEARHPNLDAALREAMRPMALLLAPRLMKWEAADGKDDLPPAA